MKIITLRKKNICWCGATLVVVCLVCTVAYAHYTLQSMRCSDLESQNIMDDLCSAAKAKTITGNLCGDICEDKRFIYLKCLSTKEGKEVYLVEHDSERKEKYILKSKHAYLGQFDSIGFMDPKSGKIIHPSNQNYYEMIWDSVGFNLHAKMRETGIDVVRRFWNGDVFEFEAKSVTRGAALDSLWALMQQDEYVLGQFTKEKNSVHFPDIYGSCGHFYMIEYVMPGRLLDPGFFEITQLKNLDWIDQVHIAVGLLNLVQSFDNDFHESLHMCDVKGENFGVAGDGATVKAIDTDMTMFDTKLKVYFVNMNCSKHSDCHFFDCKGWCDLEKGACTTHRINNNLQAVCEKIFISSSHNAFHGLLQKAPGEAHNKLESLLEMCVSPPRDPTLSLPGCSKHECAGGDAVRWAARREVLHNMIAALKSSVV